MGEIARIIIEPQGANNVRSLVKSAVENEGKTWGRPGKTWGRP